MRWEIWQRDVARQILELRGRVCSLSEVVGKLSVRPRNMTCGSALESRG